MLIYIYMYNCYYFAIELYEFFLYFEYLTPYSVLCFFNVYLFLGQRETEHERGRGREREGDTESETGSRL